MELILDKDYPLEPRATYDVDTIVEESGHGAFAKIEDNLRRLGFKNDMGGIVCRWDIDGITMDMMPTDSKILGFSNPWYHAAIENAEKYLLEPQLDILLITSNSHVVLNVLKSDVVL